MIYPSPSHNHNIFTVRVRRSSWAVLTVYQTTRYHIPEDRNAQFDNSICSVYDFSIFGLGPCLYRTAARQVRNTCVEEIA